MLPMYHSLWDLKVHCFLSKMLFSIDQLHKVSFFIGGRLGEQLGALMNCNLLLITNSEDDLESKKVAT